MRKLHKLSFAAVLILSTCLTACSKKADRECVSEPAAPPAQIQRAEPTAPNMLTETPAQSESFSVQDRSSVDTSPSNTAPKNSEPISSATDSERSATQTAPPEQIKVDIDLTGFSANMLYAELYNMGISPEDYKGKIIKLTGEFAHFPKDVDENGNPTSDEEIFVCIISDAMACCATGIEFIPEKGSSFWANYPEEGSKITVTGLCDIFLDESGWFTVIQLNNAAVEESD